MTIYTKRSTFYVSSTVLRENRNTDLYIYIFGLVMGHQTMLNPELEDHTGGDLGYLNSLFNRLFCFGQEPTPDIRNNIYL